MISKESENIKTESECQKILTQILEEQMVFSIFIV